MWLSIACHQAPDPGAALKVLSDLALPWQAFLLTSLECPCASSPGLGLVFTQPARCPPQLLLRPGLLPGKPFSPFCPGDTLVLLQGGSPALLFPTAQSSFSASGGQRHSLWLGEMSLSPLSVNTKPLGQDYCRLEKGDGKKAGRRPGRRVVRPPVAPQPLGECSGSPHVVSPPGSRAQRQGAGCNGWGGLGDCPGQGVPFWACGDRVWCLFLEKIEPEPLFIAGGHSHGQEMDGAEAVRAPAQERPIPRTPAPLSQPPRKCLWDPDIPWDRM